MNKDKDVLGFFGLIILFVIASLFINARLVRFTLPLLSEHFRNEETFKELTKTITPITFERVSFCSIREFPNKTKLDTYATPNQCAVSWDLKEHLGKYLIIRDTLYKITDLTNKRFKMTLDLYSFLPPKIVLTHGILKDEPALIISREGFKQLLKLRKTKCLEFADKDKLDKTEKQ